MGGVSTVTWDAGLERAQTLGMQLSGRTLSQLALGPGFPPREAAGVPQRIKEKTPGGSQGRDETPHIVSGLICRRLEDWWTPDAGCGSLNHTQRIHCHLHPKSPRYWEYFRRK